MPIAESRIDFVLSRLPDNSFVKNFVNTFKQYTESHTGYLTQAAFACLTQIAPTKLMTASGTVPILFFMSVGQSGTSRKSTAWSFVRRIFDPHETGYSASVAQTSSKLMEARIAYEPGSPESLVDSLEEYPRQLLIYGEGGNFLGTTQEGYMSAMRSRLNDLWDGGDVYRETVKSRKKKKEDGCFGKPAPKARLSIGAAVAPPYLQDCLTIQDMRSGFLSRFHVMYGAAERSFKGGIGNYEAAIPAIRERLELIAAQTEYLGSCLGTDAKSRELISGYENTIRDLVLRGNLHTEVSSCVARFAEQTCRIALLIAVENGRACTGQPFYLTYNEVEPAAQFAWLSIVSMSELVPFLGSGREGRDKTEILQAINGSAGYGVPLSRITLVTNRSISMHLTNLLKTLLSEGRIAASNGFYWSPYDTGSTGIAWNAMPRQNFEELQQQKALQDSARMGQVIPIKPAFNQPLG